MARLNDNIRDYLKSYILEENHSSAIMLTGPWGCGKTHFVKDFIENFSKVDKKTRGVDAKIIKNKKLIYVPLNGVTSKDEINRKLLISYLFSENKAEYAGFASHLIEGYMEFKQVPVKALKQISKSLAKLTFDRLSKIGKDNVFFFDDLERCKMEPQEIMGYINDFIEHSQSGVVIICDDSKLEEDYKIIKEKCVSREFEIIPDIDSAFDSFLETEESSYNKFLDDSKNQIFIIFKQHKHQNLRTLKNVMSDFRKFCDEIKRINKDGVEKIPAKKREILINNYLALSFGLFSDKINKSDINEDVLVNKASVSTASSKLGEKEIEDSEIYLRLLYLNLKSIGNDDSFLSYNLWSDWFKNGSFSAQNIESFLLSSSFVVEEKKSDPSWYKLWYWRDLKDDEIDSVYEEVLKDLENGKYLFAPHVLHTAGILFASSKRGFVKESILELKDKMIEYINKNGERFEYLSPVDFFLETEEWGGLGYASKDTEEFKEIKKLIYEKLVIVADKQARKWVPELFRIIKEEPDKFYRMLILDEERRGYISIPILKKEDAESIFKIVLDSKAKGRIFHTLEERVNKFNGKPEFEEERTFYKELMSKVSSYIDENKGKVSAYVLDEICKKEIDRLKSEEAKESSAVVANPQDQ
ncbi:MAG TPA: P-loop NTPase fold protein [bacterium]|nr:P-loop NTPase fold protein [bacterium]